MKLRPVISTCPGCGETRTKYVEGSATNPKLDNRPCVVCVNKLKLRQIQTEYHRPCPTCGEPIYYFTKDNLDKSMIDDVGKDCKFCACIKRNDRNKAEGKPNPFLGKKHTKESMEKAKKTKEEKGSYAVFKTQEFRDKISKLSKGENNPMYGRSVYEVWVEKYGEEEATRLEAKRVKNYKAVAKRGSHNHQYGKPSPMGSGNGWSGWFDGIYFRSLLELSFIINVLYKENKSFESGEKAKYCIKYIDYAGAQRTYFADFLVDGKELVEVKPHRLMQSVTVQSKATAATEWCSANGYTYKIYTEKDFPKLLDEEVEMLYDAGKIKFLDRYEQKFIERRKKRECPR